MHKTTLLIAFMIAFGFNASSQIEFNCYGSQTEVLIQLDVNLGADDIEWNLQSGDSVNADGYTGATESHELCLYDGCYELSLYNITDTEWDGVVSVLLENGVVASVDLDSDPTVLHFGVNSAGCGEGCTNPDALNFDEDATIDDGSCIFPGDCDGSWVNMEIDTEWDASDISWAIFQGETEIATGSGYGNYENTTEWICLADGCYHVRLFDSSSDGWNGSEFELELGEESLAEGYLPDGQYGEFYFSVGEVDCSGEDLIPGCTDPAATNYDPIANEDLGNCECDGIEVTVDIDTELGDGEIEWSIDNVIYNIDLADGVANGDDSFNVCVPDSGCFQIEFENVSASEWSGTFSVSAYGEEIASGEFGDNMAESMNFSFQVGGCGEGCTDPNAINYDDDATIDDGSCVFPEDCAGSCVELEIQTEDGGGQVSWNIVQDEVEIYGDGGYESYSENSHWICLEDGCYTFELFDSEGNGWNGGEFSIELDGEDILEGTLPNGEYGFIQFNINSPDCGIESSLPGCTDQNAINYSSFATTDDGSCEYYECQDTPVTLQFETNTGYNDIEWSVTATNNYWNLTYGNSGENTSVELCLADSGFCYVLSLYDNSFEGWSGTVSVISNEEEVLASQELGEEDEIELIFNISEDPCDAGCTDPDALNYDEEALNDDGSCILPEDCEGNYVEVELNTTYEADQITWYLLNSEEQEIYAGTGFDNYSTYTEWICLEDGCYTLQMFSNGSSPGWDGAEISFSLGEEEIFETGMPSGNFGYINFGINTDCDETVSFEGCTDPEATNYDPEATINDGSCEYEMDCEANEILIQLNPGQEGDLEWSFYSGNELIEGYGSNGMGAIEEYVYCVEDGCYNITIEDVSNNEWTGLIYIYVNGQTYLVEPVDSDSEISFDLSVNSTCGENIEGCTDQDAYNYNPEANINDGSCIYEEDCPNFVSLELTTEQWGYEISWSITQGNEIIAEGSDYENFSSYSEFACLEDGCYTLNMYDSFGDGWNGGNFTVLLGDQTIANATIGDGSFGQLQFGINTEECEENIEGCTDQDALNYNPEANIDDGSCLYEEDCPNLLDFTMTTELWGDEISWSITQGDEIIAEGSDYENFSSYSEFACLEDGCYTLEMYDTYGDGWNNGSLTISLGDETLATGNLVDGEYGVTYFSVNADCENTVIGCTDSEAYNYNPEAVLEDGSCEYCEYNLVSFSITNGSWYIQNEAGFIVESGSSLLNNTYTDSLCLPDGCYSVSVNAIQSMDASFTLLLEGDSLSEEGIGAVGQTFDFSVNSDCIDEIEGCTDQNALNYNPEANIDDGSCLYEEDCPNFVSLELEINSEYLADEISWSITQGDEIIAEGSGYENASSYSEFACLEDGCYTMNMYSANDIGWLGGNLTVLLGDQVIAIGTIDDGFFGQLQFGINTEGCQGEIEGCTDQDALNYNPEATIDDGSCIYEEDCPNNFVSLDLTTEQWGNEISWSITQGNEIIAEGSDYASFSSYSEFACLEDGCYTLNMYDSYGDGWNNGSLTISLGDETLATGNLVDGEYGVIYFSVNADCETAVIGCTDPEAYNYNPEAVLEDGSCEYCEYNLVSFTITNGSWSIQNEAGFIVEAGSSLFNSVSTDSLCLPDGCYSVTVSAIQNLDANFTLWLEGDSLSEEGIGAQGQTFDFSVNSDCTDEIEGCTDQDALNYDPEATIDNGSCFYEEDCPNIVSLDLTTEYYGFDISWSITQGDEIIAEGSDYESFSSYSEFACLEDGCYTLNMYDSFGDGWTGGNLTVLLEDQVIASGTIEDGSFSQLQFGINTEGCGEEEIEGCTDPEAINYNPNATVDDGSCEYESDCDFNNVTLSFDILTNSDQNAIAWSISSQDSDSVLVEGEYFGDVGTHDFCLPDGCYNLNLTDSSYTNSEVVSSIYVENTQVIFNYFTEPGTGETVSYSFGINTEGCGEEEVAGCTDPEAINYNEEATVDDGSCIYEEDCSITFELLADSSNLNTIFVIPSDSIGDAAGVFWDFGDGNTSTDLFPNHEYEGDGPYNLCLTVFFEVGENDTCDVTFCMEITADMIPDLIPGAGGNSSGFFINVVEDASTIGVDEEQYFENIEVYPNPTTSFVTVSSEMNWADGTTITLYNMHGAILNSQPVQFGNSNSNYKIDLSEYSSGLYFINVSSKGKQKTFKILKD